ncbi:MULTISPECIES: citrate synthase [unclassified Actinomyces]|uniref:citrate synthase n=1 Tax=unclassified Actinomyces TaxID=2609248 RepID=UPI0020178BD0|nr:MULTISPECIES: citrate synthase [unclassified Actinomyces]MCL3776901.1 citrate synthase [Actinomyces sp. AC-20-1]MCL3790320.1 citrate synthase [Actinomyces sp. 187325]MCL3792600.1 citrate synthase [Actinomyces sp. 186855]MCL3794209.1 citrate synthase [Actinomyces sp. 217892]
MTDLNDADGPGLLTIEDTSLELPRAHATEGSDGLGIAKLLGATGMVTLDPGFTNTASTTSEITYIDGGAGILRYRGYPIAELARSSTFTEVAYLLINGELPDANTFERFERRIARHRLLHEDFRSFFTSFPSSGHPMAILQAGVAGLATYYEDTLNPHDPYERELATVLLLSKVPTMVSYIARRAIGLPLMYPDPRRGYVEDFLHMTFGMPYQSFDIDPSVVRALDMLLILHADHEQNCSTSTVRLVGSSDANMYASVAAGVGALSGPLHGGANEAVLRMLDRIQNDGMTTAEFVRKVKDKEDGVRLMGFGHRVYKSYDPRAALVKATAHDVLARLGSADGDRKLEIAMELEEVALKDEYFVSRNLYPNVDFYTGLIYQAMGFPTTMFTPLFALGRLPGWIAQYREMISDPAKRIGRPRQVYTGQVERHYVAMHRRERDAHEYPDFRTGQHEIDRVNRV